MPANVVNVLVVDDDPVYRRILIHTFSKIPGCALIAAVGKISEAQEIIRKNNIRLITLDVVMEGESGLDFLPWLSKNHPKIIVALLTAGHEKRASQSIDAVLLGAVALIIKPSGTGAPTLLTEALRRVVESTQSADSSQVPSSSALDSGVLRAEKRDVIAIGASTGGPPMLQMFLKNISARVRTPIIITQHIAAQHLASLISMLDGSGGRTVVAAKDAQVLHPNCVYLASDSCHLLLTRHGDHLSVRQGRGPEENFCRPAVDPMFRSVAEVCGRAAVGIVMTGMGVDGASGATDLKRKGAPVVVQDKQSSIVWGMPGATVDKKGASFVVSGDQIAKIVSQLVL